MLRVKLHAPCGMVGDRLVNGMVTKSESRIEAEGFATNWRPGGDCSSGFPARQYRRTTETNHYSCGETAAKMRHAFREE